MRITLEWHEVEMAAQVGLRRRLESMRDGLKNKHGYKAKAAFEGDIQAAAGELAVASALGEYWDGSVGTFKRGDVGVGIQVRWTSYPDGALIVRPGDPDDDIYYLVTGQIPMFEVVGSMTGKEAKQKKYQKAPAGRPPAFFVPQSALRRLK